jgi:hypothetical protein
MGTMTDRADARAIVTADAAALSHAVAGRSQKGMAAREVLVVWRPDVPSLTYIHIVDMVSHMKTTLNIDDTVMARLRREAARSGRTMSELVETALRLLLDRRSEVPDLPPLPVFRSGGALVDVADRDALYRAMEEDG